MFKFGLCGAGTPQRWTTIQPRRPESPRIVLQFDPCASNGPDHLGLCGLVALEQFKSLVHEWPTYCSHILQMPHLRQSNPEVVSYIESSLQVSSNVLP